MKAKTLLHLAAVAAAAAVMSTVADTRPASAVVYCTAPGVPAGCVARPTARAVVYCTRPGYPVGCVARPVDRGAPGVGVRPGLGAGAPGVGIRPGVGLNAGGPVNRPGVR